MRKRSGVTLAVIGCIVFFFCVEGWGADWKFIAKDVQGTVSEIDVTSITHHPNNIVRVWVKRTYSQMTINQMVNDLGTKYTTLSYSIVLHEVHCTQNKFRILTTRNYSSVIGLIDTETSSFTEWDFITPDSMGEALLKEVCK